jgi:hypothetical protein
MVGATPPAAGPVAGPAGTAPGPVDVPCPEPEAPFILGSATVGTRAERVVAAGAFVDSTVAIVLTWAAICAIELLSSAISSRTSGALPEPSPDMIGRQ